MLLKRISSRFWDCSVSGVAVDRARQAVHDRTTLNGVTGRQIKNCYLQRAMLRQPDVRVRSNASRARLQLGGLLRRVMRVQHAVLVSALSSGCSVSY